MFRLARLSVKFVLFSVFAILGAYSASLDNSADESFVLRVGQENQDKTAETTELVANESSPLESIAKPIKWTLVVCSLPWLVIELIRYLVSRESNVVNGLTLAGLTLACTMLACLTIAFGMEGWVWLVSLVAATLVAMIYNIWIMSIAVKLES